MGSIIMLIIPVAALLPSGHPFVALQIQDRWKVFGKYFHTVKISCVLGVVGTRQLFAQGVNAMRRICFIKMKAEQFAPVL